MKKLLSEQLRERLLILIVVLAVASLAFLFQANASAKKPHNLLGSTPSEIASYAINYAQEHHEVVKGTPATLLSRSVTRGQITSLGLGCLGEFGAIEEPPLNLVILKGDFVFTTSASQRYSLDSKYLAYVFDSWSGEVVYRLASIDGSHFRGALNDPNLPMTTAPLPSSCPTQIPSSMKKLHYGDIAPAIASSPTVAITPNPTATSVIPIPPPIPSSVAP